MPPAGSGYPVSPAFRVIVLSLIIRSLLSIVVVVPSTSKSPDTVTLESNVINPDGLTLIIYSSTPNAATFFD